MLYGMMVVLEAFKSRQLEFFLVAKSYLNLLSSQSTGSSYRHLCTTSFLAVDIKL